MASLFFWNGDFTETSHPCFSRSDGNATQFQLAHLGNKEQRNKYTSILLTLYHPFSPVYRYMQLNQVTPHCLAYFMTLETLLCTFHFLSMLAAICLENNVTMVNLCL